MKQKVKHLPGILALPKQQEVSRLIQKLWIPEGRKTTVCIDSYQDGVLRGRLYDPDGNAQSFCSLSRFLVMMEDMLEQANQPQSDTTQRSFSAILPWAAADAPRSGIRRGRQATFDLQILFRQHTSWQGMILWQESHRKHSFRSVLELILLMDSALRQQKERDAG